MDIHRENTYAYHSCVKVVCSSAGKVDEDSFFFARRVENSLIQSWHDVLSGCKSETFKELPSVDENHGALRRMEGILVAGEIGFNQENNYS